MIVYVVLDEEQQDHPAAYPEWCNLSWFHDCRGITGDVEPHYHDAPEIWLWHEGSAEGVVDGKEIALRPGVLVYTPTGCLHSYQAHGTYSNTGIVPRQESWMRHGHLHVEETGENPSPEMPAFDFRPEGTTPGAPLPFPPGAFLKTAYRGQYEADEDVVKTVTTSWTAVLVREGRLAAVIDGEARTVDEPQLLIVDRSCSVKLRTEAACELAFAVGWSPGERRESR